ncbi:hypothetical protein ACJX0J_008350, partial [Zea mays]
LSLFSNMIGDALFIRMVVHGYSVKTGLIGETSLANALLDIYSEAWVKKMAGLFDKKLLPVANALMEILFSDMEIHAYALRRGFLEDSYASNALRAHLLLLATFRRNVKILYMYEGILASFTKNIVLIYMNISQNCRLYIIIDDTNSVKTGASSIFTIAAMYVKPTMEQLLTNDWGQSTEHSIISDIVSISDILSISSIGEK